MKVSELIESLKQYPQDHIVVLSRDSEGNGYEELEKGGICGVNNSFHRDDGEVSLTRLTPEAKGQGYSEEDVREGGVQCVILYP